MPSMRFWARPETVTGMVSDEGKEVLNEGTSFHNRPIHPESRLKLKTLKESGELELWSSGVKLSDQKKAKGSSACQLRAISLLHLRNRQIFRTSIATLGNLNNILGILFELLSTP